MTETLRVGLIGYGMAGREIHSPLLREVGATVTRVVTRHPARVAAAQEDWPAVLVDHDVAGLLAHRAELDLVVIASPTGDHVAHVEQTLTAGAWVVVDKPLAVTAEEAADLARLADLHDGRLTVFQNRRWDGEQLTLRSLLAEGRLGRVHRFERRWERWRPEPKNRWRENDTRAGGLLLDLGSHLVDSATQLFGPVESTYAELNSLSTPASDDVFLALTHRPDAEGHRVVSHLQAGGLVGAPGPRTRVLGDRAAYIVTSFEGEVMGFTTPGDEDPDSEGWLVCGDRREPVRRAPGGHGDFYRAAGRWAQSGGPVPVDPWDAVATARVLDAARISAQQQQVVRLDA